MVTEFLALIEQECNTHLVKDYIDRIPTERVGQAFMNVLRGTPYYDLLTGTIHDPFHHDSIKKVHAAIDFLTTK